MRVWWRRRRRKIDLGEIMLGCSRTFRSGKIVIGQTMETKRPGRFGKSLLLGEVDGHVRVHRIANVAVSSAYELVLRLRGAYRHWCRYLIATTQHTAA